VIRPHRRTLTNAQITALNGSYDGHDVLAIQPTGEVESLDESLPFEPDREADRDGERRRPGDTLCHHVTPCATMRHLVKPGLCEWEREDCHVAGAAYAAGWNNADHLTLFGAHPGGG
jgi:hypothetical protein